MPQAKVPEDLVAAVRAEIRAEMASHQEQNAVSVSEVREALRAELEGVMTYIGPWREAMRTELATALKEFCPARRSTLPPGGKSAIPRGISAFAEDIEGPSDDFMSDNLKTASGSKSPDAKINIEDRHRAAAGEHFSRFVASASHLDEAMESHLPSWLHTGHAPDRVLDSWYMWLMKVQEPERVGLLADIAKSKAFEILVCVVILLNVAFMIYSADQSIREPRNPSDLMTFGDWAFQVFYSAELLLKLIVHRQFYFINVNWKLNWFDLVLVVSGYANSLENSGVISGTFLRVLRLVKFGKAMRTVRIMARFRHLRNFLVCLQGSFNNFVWSVVMLCMVFMIFALFLMQQVTRYLEENDLEAEGELELMFGSVAVSMLTLYQAAMGGDDWSRAYRVIGETGAFASCIFITFIAFVQLALINIITGVFVESAMQTLTPDKETVALEHEQREKEYARDLEHLCNLVDADRSGKLTPDQFQDGMRKGRIPTLLTLLGLSRHHVLEFFNTMSSLAAHDDGQVNIAHFVAGCMKLKGPATNFDLQTLHSQFSTFEKSVESAIGRIDLRLRNLQQDRDHAMW